MAERKCPKCNKKSDDGVVCQHCGLNFDEYETAKQEKLIEVRVLLSEYKFQEARELAEKLPGQFPDNRTDFLLLLSNINRDISIVDKYEQAKKAYENGDHTTAAILLRNIKAFDHNLNEKVISLRRRTERNAQNLEKFDKAVEAFDSGDYAGAKSLFKQIKGFNRQEEVNDYLNRIGDVTSALLEDAVECIRKKQFDAALEKFEGLQAAFPDLQAETEQYITLLTKRIEIKNSILAAARQAKKQQRFLEAKILYAFLGAQFPEFQAQVQPQIQEIGKNAVIGLADLEEGMMLDLASLGLAGGEEEKTGSLAADCPEYVAADIITPDTNSESVEDIDQVDSNRESRPGATASPLQVTAEEVADFTF